MIKKRISSLNQSCVKELTSYTASSIFRVIAPYEFTEKLKVGTGWFYNSIPE